MAAFERLGIQAELIAGVQDLGWELPRDVQEDAIPLILGGADVMISAETGSGKTGAFVLPILQVVQETLQGEAQVALHTQKADSAMVLNVTDRDSFVAISPDGLRCQTRRDRDWGGVRASRGVGQGKWYFEATVMDEGLCRVGWATARSTRNLGTDRGSIGFGGTGKKSFGRNFEDYGTPFGLHDTIGCYITRTGKDNTVQFSKNGKLFEVAYTLPKELHTTPLFPAAVLKNAEFLFNFGATAFKHFDGSLGHRGVCTAENFASRDAPAAQVDQRTVLALIIEPTRELAAQVCDELHKMGGFLREAPRVALLVGGGNMKEQVQSAREANIVVATLGKLKAFLTGGKLDLSHVRFFVLDEADSLIVDNLNEVLALHNRLPTAAEFHFQTVICSATLHSAAITRLAAAVTRNAQWVDLKGKDAVPESVEHVVLQVDPSTGQDVDTTQVTTDGVHLRDSLRKETEETKSECTKRLKPFVLVRAITAFRMQQALVFCRTQVDCDNLHAFLSKHAGYSCAVLHGGRRQQDREWSLSAFKNGDVRFLISTDVAARGIDIQGLPFVVNMTLPASPEEYIHRVGRVGRADAVGLAVSLVGVHREKVWWHTCNRNDRGRGCTRTQLVDAGGCCIWLDEPAMLRSVEARLGAPIARLDPKDMTKGRERFLKQAADARKQKSVTEQHSMRHVSMLAPTVQELAKLEVTAQKNFLGLQQAGKWSAMLEQAQRAKH